MGHPKWIVQDQPYYPRGGNKRLPPHTDCSHITDQHSETRYLLVYLPVVRPRIQVEIVWGFIEPCPRLERLEQPCPFEIREAEMLCFVEPDNESKSDKRDTLIRNGHKFPFKRDNFIRAQILIVAGLNENGRVHFLFTNNPRRGASSRCKRRSPLRSRQSLPLT
jgi:hypothetical protein